MFSGWKHVMKPTLKGSKMRKHVGFNVGKFRNPDTLQNRIRSGVGEKFMRKCVCHQQNNMRNVHEIYSENCAM